MTDSNKSPIAPINENTERPICGVEATSRIATRDGWTLAEDVQVGADVITTLGIRQMQEARASTTPLVRLILSDGSKLIATPATKVQGNKLQEKNSKSCNRKRYQAVRLDDLRPGYFVRILPAAMPCNPVPDLPPGFEDREYGLLVGVLLGDGCISPKLLERGRVQISVDPTELEWVAIAKQLLLQAGASNVSRGTSGERSINLMSQNLGGAAAIVKHSLLVPALAYQKSIPVAYMQTNEQFLAGCLDGLFSTDGNVNLTSSTAMLRFSTTSERLAEDIKAILSYFGIQGRIYPHNSPGGCIDGRQIHPRHDSYDLLVRGEGMRVFGERIGLIRPRKQALLTAAMRDYVLTGASWEAKVISVEPAGEGTVYEFLEPMAGNWVANGVVICDESYK